MTAIPNPPERLPGWQRPRALSLAWLLLVLAATAALTNPAPPTPGRPTTNGGQQARIAAAAARAFLQDYLGWLSGHLRARDIRAASPALRARLAAERVRPSRARPQHRQIAELRTELTDPQHGRAQARVLDDDVALHITLALSRVTAGWEVTDART